MKSIMLSMVLIFSFIQPTFAEAPSTPKKSLAIVIDDFGNNMQGTEEMLNLPINLTVAVMPFMPTTKKDAELAHKNGHEVIVHLPMEPKHGKKSWLGPGAITTNLSNAEIRKRTKAAIKNVPYAIGMNNHMGSKVTEDERIMKVILEVCKEQGIFYLDSQTTNKSVVSKLATELNVPFLVNNFFFDDVYTTKHVTKQADTLAKGLIDIDQIIAIGHVGVFGPEMVNVLKEYIPVYENTANIVSLSELIPEYKFIDTKVLSHKKR